MTDHIQAQMNPLIYSLFLKNHINIQKYILFYIIIL